MASKKSITVMDMRTQFSGDFKVVKISNLIDYKIDEHLSVDQVSALCDDDEINVNIVPFKR